jgi:hypothetical protein
MKLATWFIAGLMAGILITWLVEPHAGRYELKIQEGQVLRMDTTTGQTWAFSAAGWRRLS